MRDLTFPWSAPPEVQRILDRAQHYQHEVYTVTGALPDRFIVTEDEYRFLQMLSADENISQMSDPSVDEMRLFGMQVCCPVRRSWYRDNRYMEHLKMSALAHRSIYPCDPLPALNTLELCRTELSATPRREVTCPCGEVIWDLSTCTVQYAPLGELIRQAWFGIHGGWMRADEARAALGISTPVDGGTDAKPLPPLDDVDEGLQCCGKQYQTFAQFMAHRRQHGEG